MKKFIIAIAVLGLASAVSFAQSSGNFSYATTGNGANPIACTMDSSGTISGGYTCESQCTLNSDGTSSCTSASGKCMGNAVAGIKTSSGNGNVFVIRPSAVIGLLTDVSLNSKQQTASSSALAGVNFSVSVTGPGSPNVIPNFPVTYDSRYIQISTNLFQALSTQCLAITGGCYINFNESTVSAHSFDWLVTNLQSGTYTVTTTWQDSLGGSGISQSLACVGPLNMTVQQNKIFNFNTPGGVVPVNTP